MRTRDRTKKTFDWWVKKTKDPQFLNVFRLSGLKHFENGVEAAAKTFNLDPASASDRELLLRILSAVHFPHTSSDSTLAKLTAPRGRGRPGKWDDPDARRQLMRDIDKACKGESRRPSIPKLADLLKEQFPKKDEYRIERETLIRQLQKVFPLRQGV